MPKRISDVFGLSQDALEKEGVLNGFVDVDAKFYVDPSLLDAATTPELKGSANRFREHFEEVLLLLRNSKEPTQEDVIFRKACKKLMFPEFQSISLGSSTEGGFGKGIGKGLAQKIAGTAWQIVNAGVSDPAVFELVGLIEDNIGADRISDMTIRIILPDLFSFSQRVVKKLELPNQALPHKGETYLLPIDPIEKSKIVFVPREILRDLLVADDWSDVDQVCQQNEQLRERVNTLVGGTWKKIINDLPKKRLKKFLLDEPELLADLIEQYKNKPAQKYDFAKDPAGLLNWYDLGRQYADDYPLLFDIDEVTSENIFHVVMKICNHFKVLVEDNGLSVHLWNDERKKTRNERFAQLLFFAVADSYCSAHNLDTSREPNAGRGPVDFKVSRGYNARVNVEIKYTSNNLKSGYIKQLPIYNSAERTEYSVYVVIVNTNSKGSLDSLLELQKEERKKGERVPEIFVVDGRIYPSASNL